MNNHSQTITQNWTRLYRASGACALVMVLIILVQGVVSAMAPQPLDGSALDWFLLFQKDKLIGLLDFELLMVVYTILSLPIVLSLYILHRHVHSLWAAIYVMLSVVGVVCFILARPAFEMLHVSNAYFAAETDAQRALALAAGETKLAIFHGGFFHASYLLGSLSGLVISLIMLRSSLFSRVTAYVRIASSLFDFGLYVPTIGIYLSMFSVLFLFVWNILIARRLYQLSRHTSERIPGPVDNHLAIVPDHLH